MSCKVVIMFVLLLIVMLPVFAYAQDSYQYEAIAGYIDEDFDSEAQSSYSIVVGSVFMSPVSYGNYPYYLADFFDRSSRFQFAVAETDLEYLGSIDGPSRLIGFEYADKKSPFTAGISYLDSDVDGTINNNDVELERDEVTVTLGYFIDDKSAIKMEYSDVNDKLTRNLLTRESDGSKMLFKYKKVRFLGNGRYLEMTPSFSRIDDDGNMNSEISIEADYYFTKMASVGVDFTNNSGDDSSDEGTDIGFSALIFFNRAAAIEVEYSKFSADASNNDRDLISFAVAARF